MVEILQNCVIFNDETHATVTAKENKENYQLHLEHGKPMLFGKDNKKGIRLNGLELEVVTVGENGITEQDILVHDAHKEDPTLHMMLVRMAPPRYPMALGVIRQIEATTYDQQVWHQIESNRSKSKIRNMDELLNSGETWTVNG
jgi:2-oxoglutarate ferredoxin oxidoreductase subunit beta